jgi:hypothetical protein
MRTKALLIAAAALAAGVVSSQAQVYSQNIVGYVNNPAPTGFSTQNNPFNNSNGNAITNLIVNTGTWDGTPVYIWAGHTYNVVTLDSTIPGGVADASDSFAVPAPIINPGTAFFINNGSGAGLTNTYVGSVALTTYPGTTTNTIPANAALSLISSILPIGGGITSVLGFTNVVTAGAGALDGDLIYQPNIVNGNFAGFTVTTFDSTLSTGFGDASDSFAVPEPVIPLGSGFFFNNGNVQTVNWIQTLSQ